MTQRRRFEGTIQLQLSGSSPFMAGVVDGALEHRVLVVQLAIGHEFRRRTPPCCRNQFIQKKTCQSADLQFGVKSRKDVSWKLWVCNPGKVGKPVFFFLLISCRVLTLTFLSSNDLQLITVWAYKRKSLVLSKKTLTILRDDGTSSNELILNCILTQFWVSNPQSGTGLRVCWSSCSICPEGVNSNLANNNKMPSIWADQYNFIPVIRGYVTCSSVTTFVGKNVQDDMTRVLVLKN